MNTLYQFHYSRYNMVWWYYLAIFAKENNMIRGKEIFKKILSLVIISNRLCTLLGIMVIVNILVGQQLFNSGKRTRVY